MFSVLVSLTGFGKQEFDQSKELYHDILLMLCIWLCYSAEYIHFQGL